MRCARLGSIAVLLSGFALAAGTAQTPSPKSTAPLTLDDAIKLAEANEPSFAAAVAESRATSLESKDAKAGLLPSVTFHNQYLFTESNHTKAATSQGGVGQSLPVFIANNACLLYTSRCV